MKNFIPVIPVLLYLTSTYASVSSNRGPSHPKQFLLLIMLYSFDTRELQGSATFVESPNTVVANGNAIVKKKNRNVKSVRQLQSITTPSSKPSTIQTEKTTSDFAPYLHLQVHTIYAFTLKIMQETNMPSMSPTADCPSNEAKMDYRVRGRSSNDDETFVTLYSKTFNGSFNVIDRRSLSSGNIETEAQIKVGACIARDQCYKLEITDSGGDGLCCDNVDGFYTVFYDST